MKMRFQLKNANRKQWELGMMGLGHKETNILGNGQTGNKIRLGERESLFATYSHKQNKTK